MVLSNQNTLQINALECGLMEPTSFAWTALLLWFGLLAKHNFRNFFGISCGNRHSTCDVINKGY